MLAGRRWFTRGALKFPQRLLVCSEPVAVRWRLRESSHFQRPPPIFAPCLILRSYLHSYQGGESPQPGGMDPRNQARRLSPDRSARGRSRASIHPQWPRLEWTIFAHHRGRVAHREHVLCDRRRSRPAGRLTASPTSTGCTAASTMRKSSSMPSISWSAMARINAANRRFLEAPFESAQFVLHIAEIAWWAAYLWQLSNHFHSEGLRQKRRNRSRRFLLASPEKSTPDRYLKCVSSP